MDYIQQLEDANYTLQQKVEELQISNENLSAELKKYNVHLKNFSKSEWNIYIGYCNLGTVQFDSLTSLYTVNLSNNGGTSDKFCSLQDCRNFVINYITTLQKASRWNLTI